jgi:hypothetical protein
MAVTPYKEKEYVQSEAVAKAQQALQSHHAGKPGGYQSQYQSGLDSLLGQIQNREKFHYDVNADALYSQVAQNYLRQGQQAMMDTMGQAAALTGGYGNSYAQTAGQQQYNEYLLGLSQLVPQFQQMALEQYRLEGDDLLNRYNLLMQQCAECGFVPNIVREPTTMESLFLCVEMGMGVAMLDRNTRLERNTTLRIIDFPESRTTGLVAAWRKDNRNPLVPALIKALTE